MLALLVRWMFGMMVSIFYYKLLSYLIYLFELKRAGF